MDVSENSANEFIYKVLVVGDAGTGKTSVIKRYVHNMFSTQYKSTIGVDFALKIINRGDDTIRLQLWDIAGQERFGNMTRIYYRDAMGAFIVFDITRRDTFENVMKWKNDIDTKVLLSDNHKIPVVLLANKCDISDQEIPSDSEMEIFCQENGFVGWFRTSAKDNIGIDDASASLIDNIIIEDKSMREKAKSISLVSPKNSNSGCC